MVIRIFAFLFFLFFSGNTDKINYYFNWQTDPCPFLWGRPRHTELVPSSRFEFESTTHTGGRHHVIPYDLLRNFFTAALTQSREESEFGLYLSEQIYQIKTQFISNEVSIQTENPIIVGDAIVTVDLNKELFAALAWLPGNIFIGPLQEFRHHDDPLHQRGGDPGNAFEQYANRIIRDDVHFTALQNLYTDMLLFKSNTLRLDLFDRIMQNLDIVNRRTTPFPFNPEDWEVENGKFYIRDSSNKRNRKKRYQSQIPKPSVTSNSEPSSNDDPFDYYVGFCNAVKRKLTESNISINKAPSLHNAYINVADKMQIDCLPNTYIIVKRATIKAMPLRIAILSFGIACISGDCKERDGTEKMKKLCDNKNSCVFDSNETDGLDIDVEWYCSDMLTSIKERKELQKTWRYGSNEFELNCPVNYYIRVNRAMRKSSVLTQCIVDDCKEKDITAIIREKCDGENPCKKELEDWGLNPIVLDFSCIPNPSMFTGTDN